MSRSAPRFCARALERVGGAFDALRVAFGDGLSQRTEQDRALGEIFADDRGEELAVAAVELAKYGEPIRVDRAGIVRRGRAGGRACRFGLGRDPALEHVGDVLGPYGFGDVVVHTCLEADLAVAFHCRGGHGDHREMAARRGFELPQRPGGFVAVHFRHLAVHEHRCVVARCDGGKCFAAVVGYVDVVSELCEHASRDELIHVVVFYQQDHDPLSPRVGRRRRGSASGVGAVGDATICNPSMRQSNNSDWRTGLLSVPLSSAELATSLVTRPEELSKKSLAGAVAGSVLIRVGKLEAVHVGHVQVEDREVISRAPPRRRGSAPAHSARLRPRRVGCPTNPAVDAG